MAAAAAAARARARRAGPRRLRAATAAAAGVPVAAAAAAAAAAGRNRAWRPLLHSTRDFIFGVHAGLTRGRFQIFERTMELGRESSSCFDDDSESIRVAIRVRPLSEAERIDGECLTVLFFISHHFINS